MADTIVDDLGQPLIPRQDSGDSSEPLSNNTEEPTEPSTDADAPLPLHDATPQDSPWKNHNVLLSLGLCVVAGVADSIWGSVVLSGFLLALAKSMGRSSTANTLVGTAEAVEGLTELVTALPVGYAADIWGKAKIVRLGGVLMLVTIGVTLWTLWEIDATAAAEEEHLASSTAVQNRSYIILVVALGLWGIINGISFGPSQALYSDSIAQGQRSKMLTYLYSCYLVSSSVGPLVSIILTLTVAGNAEDWSIRQMFPVFFVGVCLEIPAAIIMFFFSEKHIVPETEDAPLNSVRNSESANETSNEHLAQPLLDSGGDDPESAPSPTQTTDLQESSGFWKPQTIVPSMLFMSSLIVSLGSGASVKYFPLFFKEVGFSNTEVQGIFLIVPLAIAGLSFAAHKLGAVLGRIEATLAFDAVGVSLLYFMTWLSSDIGSATGDGPSLREANPWKAIFIVAIYLLRTAIMNCPYPLLESILMDAVPSNQRARWKSLESIASFGWTGSALLGGILSDAHSYQFTFSITATLQLVGALILIPIRTMVKQENDPVVQSTSTDDDRDDDE